MRKTFILLAAAVMSLAACNRVEPVQPRQNGEMSVIPINSNAVSGTKGYVENSSFVETTYETLHGTKAQNLRTMQISAYLHPQNGEDKNYFVDKTYSAKTDALTETVWWNTNTVGGAHDPIYWPVGGTLDFLAYSVSAEQSGAGRSVNVNATWDETNASSKVVLTVPGENSQNDILYAGIAGIASSTGANAVPLQFNHSQAWLQFALTGSTDEANPDGIVTLKRIELENVYNAGTLSVSNNRGNTIAKWDFTEETKQNIEVDNLSNVSKLNAAPQYLDMLIPQQAKTAFVLYYTLGSNASELSYRFTTDQKTWLMGEKYIYNINITTSEVTVAPKVAQWNEVNEYNYTVKLKKTFDDGAVTPTFTPAEAFTEMDTDADGITTYACNTWGAQITLEAAATDPAIFVKWSDGNTENPRTFSIYADTEIPEAIFAEPFTLTLKKTFDDGTVTPTFTPADGFTEISTDADGVTTYYFFEAGQVELEAVPTSPATFTKWSDDNTDNPRAIAINAEDTALPDAVFENSSTIAFTVNSSDKKVQFSAGNLYWNGSAFAEETSQLAYTSSWDANHVDRFYWSSDAAIACAVDYNDPSASTTDTFFAADGGAISGKTVLSDSEWSYLLNSRTNASSLNKAGVTINGTMCLVIAPDDFAGTIASSYDTAAWATAEAAGLVALPAAGSRSGSNISATGSFGGYCSSTPDEDMSGIACCLYFGSSSAYTFDDFRNVGYSVRLVTVL